MAALNADRFRPGLENLRQLEQRLTGLVPAETATAIPKAPLSLELRDQRLDAALRDTFPASDPVSISGA